MRLRTSATRVRLTSCPARSLPPPAHTKFPPQGGFTAPLSIRYQLKGFLRPPTMGKRKCLRGKIRKSRGIFKRKCWLFNGSLAYMELRMSYKFSCTMIDSFGAAILPRAPFVFCGNGEARRRFFQEYFLQVTFTIVHFHQVYAALRRPLWSFYRFIRRQFLLLVLYRFAPAGFMSSLVTKEF